MNAQPYFEDVQPGDEIEESWVAEPTAVFSYLGVAQPELAEAARFREEEAARTLGLDRAIVPGMMSLSVLNRLVTDWMGPLGRLHDIDVNFRRPVLHEDRLRVLGLITEVEEINGRPTVKLDIFLENERGERPLQGVAIVELPRRLAT